MEKDLDRNRDVPAEANREQHINFLEVERSHGDNHAGDECMAPAKEDENRRREWAGELKEGREAASKNND